MRIELRLSLPRDSSSVPLARRMVAAALDSLGTTTECRYDIQLAVAEACGNVVKHAEPTDRYEVMVLFDGELCTIEVIDGGPGFDPGAVSAARTGSEPVAESGRGLRIMRMVTDRFELRRLVGGGTVVRFVKRLAWAHSALALVTGAG